MCKHSNGSNCYLIQRECNSLKSWGCWQFREKGRPVRQSWTSRKCEEVETMLWSIVGARTCFQTADAHESNILKDSCPLPSKGPCQVIGNNLEARVVTSFPVLWNALGALVIFLNHFYDKFLSYGFDLCFVRLVRTK